MSRSGSKPDKWAAGQSWVEKVSWTKGDPTAGDLSPVFSKAAAVISCVGVIGGSDEEMEKGNGDVNVAAASQVYLFVGVTDWLTDRSICRPSSSTRCDCGCSVSLVID